MLTITTKSCERLFLALQDPVGLGKFFEEFGFAGMCAVLIGLLVYMYRQQLKEREEHNLYMESTHKQQMEIIEKLNVTIGQSSEIQRRSLDIMDKTHMAVTRCLDHSNHRDNFSETQS